MMMNNLDTLNELDNTRKKLIHDMKHEIKNYLSEHNIVNINVKVKSGVIILTRYSELPEDIIKGFEEEYNLRLCMRQTTRTENICYDNVLYPVDSIYTERVYYFKPAGGIF